MFNVNNEQIIVAPSCGSSYKWNLKQPFCPPLTERGCPHLGGLKKLYQEAVLFSEGRLSENYMYVYNM